MTRHPSRNFPVFSLQESLVIAQAIQDQMAGMPFKRLLLAEAIGVKPASSNFRSLLSSSYKYGLTDGTEKSTEISLTDLGERATKVWNEEGSSAALVDALFQVPLYKRFFEGFEDKKLPSNELLPRILASDYEVPVERAPEAASQLIANGRHVGIIHDISGSAHVMLDTRPAASQQTSTTEPEQDSASHEQDDSVLIGHAGSNGSASPERNTEKTVERRPIFLGHGKNTEAVEAVQKLLRRFRVESLIVVDEANLARPISQKVRDGIAACGSAILIFTKDLLYYDAEQNEIWRPSENVIHELGATSYVYDNRVVIFKEKGVTLPSNFSDTGYIEFESGSIDAKATELLFELIGFGILSVTPA